MKKQTLKKTPILFKKYNFAQPIADNGSDLTIVKKLNGKSHSLETWKTKFFRTYQGFSCVDRDDSKIFLEQLKEVEKFPLKAYVDFAKQVKYLSDNNQRIDGFNPNNLLVDSKLKKFTVIDLLDKAHLDTLSDRHNCIFDMVCLLCDVQLHSQYRKNLTEREIKVFDELTKNVVKKCEIAGNYVGLDANPDTAFATFIVDDNLSTLPYGLFKSRYENAYGFYNRYCV